MKLLEAGNATMGVWLGKNILHQVDEIRHELFGNISTTLQLVIPRDLQAAQPNATPALDVSQELIEAGEDDEE
jgi:hypothetical protein